MPEYYSHIHARFSKTCTWRHVKCTCFLPNCVFEFVTSEYSEFWENFQALPCHNKLVNYVIQNTIEIP